MIPPAASGRTYRNGGKDTLVIDEETGGARIYGSGVTRYVFGLAHLPRGVDQSLSP